MAERSSEPTSIDAPPAGNGHASVASETKSARTDPDSGLITPEGRKSGRTRKLLLGLLGALILAGAIVFGIPAIRLAFNTVSTDDAYVNGHVTFVAARVRGQVSRVLADDNNRVRQGDLLVELDKEPYQTALSVNIIERPKSGALKIAIPAFQPLAAPTMSQMKVHL